MDASDIYYSDNPQLIDNSSSEWMGNTVLIGNQGITWQEDGPEITVDYSETAMEETLTENDGYLTAEADDSNETSQYFSILESNCESVENEEIDYTTTDVVNPECVVNVEVGKEEIILPDITKTEFENKAEDEKLTNDHVVLYRMEGSEDLFAVQIADDGNGNLQKYQYKVRQTVDGQFEAVPGTIEIQTADPTDITLPEETNNSKILRAKLTEKDKPDSDINLPTEPIPDLMEQNITSTDDETTFYDHEFDTLNLLQNSYTQSHEPENFEAVAVETECKSGVMSEEFQPEDFINPPNIYPPEDSESEYEVEELDDEFRDDLDEGEVYAEEEEARHFQESLPEDLPHKFTKEEDLDRSVTIFKDEKHLSYLVVRAKEKENALNSPPGKFNRGANLRSILKSNCQSNKVKAAEIASDELSIKQEVEKKGQLPAENVAKAARQPRKQRITPVERAGSEIIVQPLIYALDGNTMNPVQTSNSVKRKRVIDEILQVSDESDPDFTLKPIKRRKQRRAKFGKRIRQKRTIEITIEDSEDEAGSDNSVIEVLDSVARGKNPEGEKSTENPPGKKRQQKETFVNKVQYLKLDVEEEDDEKEFSSRRGRKKGAKEPGNSKVANEGLGKTTVDEILKDIEVKGEVEEDSSLKNRRKKDVSLKSATRASLKEEEEEEEEPTAGMDEDVSLKMRRKKYAGLKNTAKTNVDEEEEEEKEASTQLEELRKRQKKGTNLRDAARTNLEEEEALSLKKRRKKETSLQNAIRTNVEEEEEGALIQLEEYFTLRKRQKKGLKNATRLSLEDEEQEEEASYEENEGATNSEENSSLKKRRKNEFSAKGARGTMLEDDETTCLEEDSSVKKRRRRETGRKNSTSINLEQEEQEEKAPTSLEEESLKKRQKKEAGSKNATSLEEDEKEEELSLKKRRKKEIVTNLKSAEINMEQDDSNAPEEEEGQSTEKATLVFPRALPSPRKNKCPMCPKTFPKQIILKKHMTIHNARRSLRSRTNDSSISTEIDSSGEKSSREGRTSGDNSSKGAETKSLEVGKVSNLRKSQAFNCNKCKLKFLTETQFKRHQTIHGVRLNPSKDPQLRNRKMSPFKPILRSSGRPSRGRPPNSSRTLGPKLSDLKLRGFKSPGLKAQGSSHLRGSNLRGSKFQNSRLQGSKRPDLELQKSKSLSCRFQESKFQTEDLRSQNFKDHRLQPQDLKSKDFKLQSLAKCRDSKSQSLKDHRLHFQVSKSEDSKLPQSSKFEDSMLPVYKVQSDNLESEDSESRDFRPRDLKCQDSELQDSKLQLEDSKSRDSKPRDLRSQDLTLLKSQDFKDLISQDSKLRNSKLRDLRSQDSVPQDLKWMDSKPRDLKVQDSESQDYKLQSQDSNPRDHRSQDLVSQDSKLQMQDSKSRNSKFQNLRSQDVMQQDSKSKDSKLRDLRSQDLTSQDTKLHAQDLNSKDLNPRHLRSQDFSSQDSEPRDSKFQDSKTSDSKLQNFRPKDSLSEDVKLRNSKSHDLGSRDSRLQSQDSSKSRDFKPRDLRPQGSWQNSRWQDSKLQPQVSKLRGKSRDNEPQPDKHPLKSLKCEYCSQTFSQKSQLTIHHAAHKTFPCPSCKTTFTAKILLDDHLRKNCVVFSQKSRRTPQKKIKKPLKCEDCSKVFPTPKSLRMHSTVAHRVQSKFSASSAIVSSAPGKLVRRKNVAHTGVPINPKMQRAFDKMKLKT